MLKSPLTYYNGIIGSLKPGDFVETGGAYPATTFSELTQILAVPGLSTVTTTVKVVSLENFRLVGLEYAGENKAKISVLINDVLQAEGVINYLKFKDATEFPALALEIGDTIKVVVENISNSVANFSARLVYYTFEEPI